MGKTKNKPHTKAIIKPIAKAKTTKDLAKEALNQRAAKAIDKLKKIPFSQNFICEQINCLPQTLSKFMNLKEDYITTSMVDKVEKFVKQCEVDPSVYFAKANSTKA